MLVLRSFTTFATLFQLFESMSETLASWHPIIVHFAVAFAIGSAAFDVLDFLFHRKRFEDTGFHLLLVGLPFLLFAVLTGNLAEAGIPDGTVEAAALERHMTYANIAVWLFSGVGLWRVFLQVRKQYHGGKKVVYIFVVTAAAVSVYLTALHGGNIRHGVKADSGERITFSPLHE